MKAFYAGSFDPFTNGHLYIVQQAAKIFDEVIIALGDNPRKAHNLSREKMKEAIESTLVDRGLENVRVVVFSGLTVNKAKEMQADFLIRGLRNGVDYDFEENLAMINYKLEEIETIYFRAGDTTHISSSMVLELWRNGAEVSEFVPASILEILE